MIRTLFLLSTLAAPALAQDAPRVITLGGSVTEIAVALGAEDRLVARDTTSNFPESIRALPDVGYIRALSPENILALDPTLIVAEGDAGPPEAVEVLKAAGIPFVLVPEANDPNGVVAKIAAVADALDLPGDALAAEVQAGLDAASARAAEVPTPKRVLFILSLQGGRVMAGGEGTEAEGIIRLAGGINAATGFQGYKPMTDEAVLAAGPRGILMEGGEGAPSLSEAAVRAPPGPSPTPPAQAGAIVRMDGMLLLGFGPRTPDAAKALHDTLYGSVR